MEKIRKLTPLKVDVLQGKSKYAPAILSEAVYLDTETSNNFNAETGEGNGWIYQWAFRFAGEWAWGRKPSELIKALTSIAKVNSLYQTKCIVYVHNLSYDIQYLKDWLIDLYGADSYTLIATAPHKFISFSVGCWIFKCTYKLSNRSLSKWAKDLGTQAKKQEGLIDYEVTRYQDTRLTYDDWKYMYFDVLTLEQCVKKQMSLYGDTLTTIPLTSTGYIRRDARKRFKENNKNRQKFSNTALNPKTYKMFRRAFAGGITHQNRFMANNIVTPPKGYTIRHRDFRSHYPTQQVAKEEGFPTTEFILFYKHRKGRKPFTFADVDKWTRTHCLIMDIAITNLEVKQGVTIPYAQSVKFYEGRTKDFVRTIDDNGRVLRAKGTSVISVTEIDLKWLRKQYTFDYLVLEVYGAVRGCCPKFLTDTVKEKYLGKTQFKDELKQAKKDGASPDVIIDKELSLMKSKNGLNGIYGMSATNPVRLEYAMDENGEWTPEKLTDDLIETKLKKFYNSRNNFMSYQLGVYTTALARDDLMTIVEIIGYNNVLYVDTDSAFYLSNPEVEKRIEAYNKERNDHAERIGAYIVHKGVKTYFDAFDDEEENILRFVSLHAKAYAYETPEGLHCTIAGVPERGRNGNTRVKELGKMENMKEGFVFHDCGGTRCAYTEQRPVVLNINGHLTEVSSSAIILPVEKTLSGLITHEEFMEHWEIDEV